MNLREAKEILSDCYTTVDRDGVNVLYILGEGIDLRGSYEINTAKMLVKACEVITESFKGATTNCTPKQEEAVGNCNHDYIRVQDDLWYCTICMKTVDDIV